MGKYRKSIAAFIGAVGTWGVSATADGSGITANEYFGLLLALGTTAAVWGLANDDS